MSDILGYDVNSRPLRIGDKCVVTGLVEHPEYNGMQVEIVAPSWSSFMPEDVTIRHDAACDKNLIHPSKLRKLDNHRGAGSWSEVMTKLKQPEHEVCS